MFDMMLSLGKAALAMQAIAGFLATCAQGSPLSNLTEETPTLPGGYIVEFENTDSLVGNFYSNLSSSKISAVPRMTLSHALFNGASFVLHNGHDNLSTVATIQSFSSVKAIWPLHIFKTQAQNLTILNSSSSSTSPLKKRDTDTYPVHVMGGVDKLRAKGYAGEGMFVAIVDSGVDFNHPALGGGFGPGFKIAHGYDLVGDGYDGTNTPVPGPYPSDCLGHGTHVSGIVGANPNEWGITGVVPNATLGMYRVIGCGDGVTSDVLIAGFTMAYNAGPDLITCSIGGRSGWSEGPWEVVVQRIVEAGVPCTIAAGNDGKNALFDTSGPADAIGAISVASVDNIDDISSVTTASSVINGTTTAVDYMPGILGDFGDITLPLFAPNFNTSDPADACNPLAPGTQNMSSYVVLVRRGTCSFDTKIQNLQAFGAKYVLFYNNVVDALVAPSTTIGAVPCGIVSSAVGADWISKLSSGVNISVQFASSVAYTPNTLSGGYTSYYTSWGPTNDLAIKPAVAGPGGGILSTFPVNQGSWAVYSGTSMATPYIAGVVALLKQIRGKGITPQEITNRLSSTAKPLAWNDGSTTSSFLAPVVQQGGGLVNAYDAVYHTTTLDIDVIALNDTQYFKSSHTFTIQNTSPHAVKYTFSHTGAVTAQAFLEEIPVMDTWVPVLVEEYATVSFSPSSITVAGNSAQRVTARFTPPVGTKDITIPVYSGFLLISGNNGENLTIPYAGVASELRKTMQPMIGGYAGYLLDSSTDDYITNSTFALAGPGSSYIPSRYPQISVVCDSPAALMRFEVIPKNTTGLQSVLGEKILGNLPDTPIQYISRYTNYGDNWDGILEGDIYAPAGEYRFLLRALYIHGDVKDKSAYQSWYSDYFNITYV